MSQFKPDDALMGCPLYRRLLPNKWKAQVTEAAFLLVMFGGDFAGVWAIESREIRNDLMIAQNIGLYVLLFAFTMMMILVSVHESRHAKQEMQHRAERLRRISEAGFWALDQEVSMAELRYGTFYFLKDYLYAPHERLLLSYRDIASWRFGDHFGTLTGTLKDQYLILTEADGFETKLLVRQRAALVQDHDQVKVKLDYYMMKAKYPNGSPYSKNN